MIYFVKLTLIYHLFDLKVTADARRSPCLETRNWEPFKLLCGENHTIYVKHHHIRNVIKAPNLTTSCDGQWIGSREVTLPLNKEITYYLSPFAKTVSSCNNKRECTLQRTYVENTEETLLRSSITDYVGPLCHSVEYECIPDFEVMQNCSHEVGTDYKQFYLKLFRVEGKFSCQIMGRILGIEILHTYQTGIRISSNNILLYEHEKFNTGVYGESFLLLTNQLTIEVQSAAIYNYILLKVQIGTSGNHVMIRPYSHGMPAESTSHYMTAESTKNEDFRDKFNFSPLIWVSTVITIMISLLMILSIIQQQRLLKRKSTEIHVKAADKTFVLRSCRTYGGDLKIEIHKAKCMCIREKPSKLKSEKQPLYENSVSYLTESQDQQCSSSVNCEPPREEEELYIEMVPSA